MVVNGQTQQYQVDVVSRDEPFFVIEILNIDRSVKIGSNFDIEFEVENIGNSGSQNVSILISDSEKEVFNFSLGFQETVTQTVSIDTSTFNTGKKTVTVESESEFTFYTKNFVLDKTASDSRNVEFFLFDSPIESTFDELAIDDGTIVDEFGDYHVKIYPRTSETVLESKVENISYSPKINSAPTLSVDVEPVSELEGTEYLSSILSLYVNEKPIFVGDVEEIDTTQDEGEFYTVSAKSPGKKLKDRNVDENVQSQIKSDYIGAVIDKYNRYDSSHIELIGTSQENTTDIKKSNNSRVANSDNSKIKFTDVGEDALDIDIIRFKAYTDSDITVSIESNTSSYSDTFSSLNSTSYGEWAYIEPDNLSSDESYDIIFSLSSDSVLYDWISLNERELDRKIFVEEADFAFKDKELKNISDNNFKFEENFDIDDNEPWLIEDGKLKPAKTCYVKDTADTTGGLVEDEKFSSAEARRINLSDVSFTLDLEYEIQNPELTIRRDVPDTNNDGETSVISHQVKVDGEEVRRAPKNALYPGLEWRKIFFSGLDSVGPGEVEVEVSFYGGDSNELYSNSRSSEGNLDIDAVALYDDDFSFDFDETDLSTVSRQHINAPQNYSDDVNTIESDDIVLNDSLTRAEVQLDSSIQELGLSVDNGQSFSTSSNTSSVETDIKVISSSVRAKLGTVATSPDGARNEAPRFGYDTQKINSIVFAGDAKENGIIFNKDISGNRLKVISDLTDDSRYFYRWDGSTCKIFRRGTQKTSVDLRKEDISSKVSIKDVYDKCEVRGDGVSSGVITADDSPDFVDRKKVITDPEIENKRDAIRKAKTFLSNNSSIEYEGEITTLPTKAPLGEELDGSIFNHGKDMFIESVRYGKRRSTIKLGRTKNLSEELIKINRDVDSNTSSVV